MNEKEFHHGDTPSTGAEPGQGIRVVLMLQAEIGQRERLAPAVELGSGTEPKTGGWGASIDRYVLAPGERAKYPAHPRFGTLHR